MTVISLSIFSCCTLLMSSCGQANNTTARQMAVPAESVIQVGRSPGSVETGDFNNDGIPDLAITSETDSSVTILLGEGNAVFKEAKSSPFYAGPMPNDICIYDFNKDGNIDMAFANHEQKYLTVLLGNGLGDFTPAMQSPFLTQGIPHVHGVAVGDFNGDGRPDLVTDSWGNNHVEVLFGDSPDIFKTPGSFFKVGKRPYQRLRVADVDGDGIQDIVTTNSEGNNATVLLADGKGSFNEVAGSPFACGDAPFGIAIADINADGKPDLAVVNSPASMAEGRGKNGLTILLGDGTGKFTTLEGSPFGAGKIPNRVATGDINGDGVNDIATTDNGSDKIYVFFMNKNGSISAQSVVTVGQHPKGIVVVDLNADGKADIVVCNQLDDTISIIQGKSIHTSANDE